MTVDSSEIRVYQDGALLSSDVRSGDLKSDDSNTHILIGKDGRGGTNYSFDGLIDEVAMYNRALTPDEIQQHYQNGLAGLGYEVTACVQPPSDMINWWDADSVTGTTAEDIQGENDGTFINGATTAPGIVGNAFSLDKNTNDFVSMGAFTFPAELTIDAWIRLDHRELGVRDTIIATAPSTSIPWGQSGIALYDNPDTGLRQLTYYVDPNSSNRGYWYINYPFVEGMWHHIAVTQLGPDGLPTIYVDGVSYPVVVAVNKGTPYHVSAPLSLGRQGGFHGSYFKGAIDEVELYNRVLTAAEIQSIYNAGSAGKCKDVQTNNPPVASCKNVTVYLDATGNATIVPGDVDNGSSDPDGDPILSVSVSSFDCNDIGANDVILTVSDGELSDSCTATVFVVDNIAPALSDIPADVTVECNSVPVAASPTATDNCDTKVAISFNESRVNGSCPDSYTLTRTWTATDDTGNESSQSQTITVQDIIAPEVTATLVPVKVKKKHGCFRVEFSVTDNCDDDPTLSAELNGHPVTNGELVRLRHKKHKKKGCRVKIDDDSSSGHHHKRGHGSSDDDSSSADCGTVKFECNVFTLTVTATDHCGNVGTGTAEHVFDDDSSSGHHKKKWKKKRHGSDDDSGHGHKKKK